MNAQLSDQKVGGWYVANSLTGVVVRGPYVTRANARDEKRRIDDKYHGPPGVLRVYRYEIGEDA